MTSRIFPRRLWTQPETVFLFPEMVGEAGESNGVGKEFDENFCGYPAPLQYSVQVGDLRFY
jgi:hypothetical protein